MSMLEVDCQFLIRLLSTSLEEGLTGSSCEYHFQYFDQCFGIQYKSQSRTGYSPLTFTIYILYNYCLLLLSFVLPLWGPGRVCGWRRWCVICFLTGQTLQALYWIVRQDPSVLDYTLLFVLSRGVSSLGLYNSCQASQCATMAWILVELVRTKTGLVSFCFFLDMDSWGLYGDLMFFPVPNCWSSFSPSFLSSS